jgi:hypothetical protein
MNKKLQVWGGVVLGIVFVVLAVFYWTTPAGSLPAFFPGYAAGSAVVHFKHGLASLILGVACFIFAWFGTAKKAS